MYMFMKNTVKILYFKNTNIWTLSVTRRLLSLTIDESVSGPLSLLPPLLPDCYFSCRRAETALGLDVGTSTNTALCIIKHCVQSSKGTRIMCSTFALRLVHKGTVEVWRPQSHTHRPARRTVTSVTSHKFLTVGWLLLRKARSETTSQRARIPKPSPQLH